jgi:hypothetical protein
MPITVNVGNFEVEITSEKELPDKPARELMHRNDVALTIRRPDGSVRVRADRFGYSGDRESVANATPFTNLQRYITAYGQ